MKLSTLVLPGLFLAAVSEASVPQRNTDNPKDNNSPRTGGLRVSDRKKKSEPGNDKKLLKQENPATDSVPRPISLSRKKLTPVPRQKTAKTSEGTGTPESPALCSEGDNGPRTDGPKPDDGELDFECISKMLKQAASFEQEKDEKKVVPSDQGEMVKDEIISSDQGEEKEKATTLDQGKEEKEFISADQGDNSEKGRIFSGLGVRHNPFRRPEKPKPKPESKPNGSRASERGGAGDGGEGTGRDSRRSGETPVQGRTAPEAPSDENSNRVSADSSSDIKNPADGDTGANKPGIARDADGPGGLVPKPPSSNWARYKCCSLKTGACIMTTATVGVAIVGLVCYLAPESMNFVVPSIPDIWW
jgi:hypothetical protein